MSPTTDMGTLIPLEPEALLALGGSARPAAPGTVVLAPDAPMPDANTVHVWAFKLDGPPALVETCRAILSPAERQRADRFIFERDRVHHTVAHGVMRHLLGRYCGIAPSSLHFRAAASGKPSLAWPAGSEHRALQFNLTHSENRALLAVSAWRELGVDLERVRANLEALDISRHYFFGAEREAIENALSAMRDNTFFRYWVAKEAVLKAQGVGLGFPLDRFCIRFFPGGDSASIETLDPTVLEPEWTVRMLPCDTGWVAAVAARGSDWKVARGA